MKLPVLELYVGYPRKRTKVGLPQITWEYLELTAKTSGKFKSGEQLLTHIIRESLNKEDADEMFLEESKPEMLHKNIYVQPEHWEKIQEIRKKKNWTMAELVRQLLQKF